MRLDGVDAYGGGYFFVWTVFGMAVFPLGAALATIEMRLPALARAVPIVVGAVVLTGGALQFTAWRYGLRLGLHCSHCCAGMTAVLVVVGIMDPRAMALVTTAITAERLAPAGKRVARAMGAVMLAAALLLIARAVGIG